MPTERFYNLPEEKRIRVIQAVYEEMCRVPYDEVSINKIIQKAEIPRGSFYQYFRDKDELLEFMLADFQEQLFSAAKGLLIEAKGDIFETYYAALKRMVRIGEQEHNCTLLKNVCDGLKFNHIHNINFLKIKGEDYFLELYELSNKDNMKINDREDFKEVANLLAMLMWNAGMEIFLDLSKKDEILKKAERRINMIKYGVMKEEN